MLVTGLALTGGAGLLVVGPMFGAMSALGMGALAGGLMGAGSNAVGRKLSIEEEIAEAIDAGQWVIVVHCHTEAEVARAQGVLSDRRILREAEPKTIAPSEVAALEQIDVNKLAAVVQDAFLPLTKLSTIPIEEVMCDFEKIDAPELKQAAEKALKQIATATGLSTTQVTDIFKANRFTNTNIVGCLYEQSGVKRQHI